MATILRQAPTGDGYDVRFLAKGGEAYTLHFLKEPDKAAIAQAVAQYETELAKPQDKNAELASKVSEMLNACAAVKDMLDQMPELAAKVTDVTANAVLDALTAKAVK